MGKNSSQNASAFPPACFLQEKAVPEIVVQWGNLHALKIAKQLNKFNRVLFFTL